MGMNDINRFSHTKWNCKYHIVFAPKYRRKVFYREKRAAIGKILRQLCEWKGVKIIEAEACPDHIHLFVEIPPKMSPWMTENSRFTVYFTSWVASGGRCGHDRALQSVCAKHQFDKFLMRSDSLNHISLF